ncbi:TPA: hypothetical protein DCZ15_03185 [Candidatus Falkowbacteria bacterium]|nr:MAG: hypothetical protein UV95_C0002G0023 [Candidatus Falkowbacteria bacterium GW2011_GWF2_43_32]HBA36853.1 hypothetical protein [Candidatus Falkowbacteria bacterium]
MIKYYTRKEYQKIAFLYDLGIMRKIEKLHIGYGGSAKVSVLTGKGKFVISKNLISRGKGIVGKTKKSLQYEIEMLQTVKDLSVPHFIKSKNNNFVEKFKDAWVSVYFFIPGKPPKNITKKMAYQLGGFFGSFHKKSAKFQTKLVSRRRYYDLSPVVMDKMRPFAYNQENPILKKVVAEVERGVINNRPSKKLLVGPIHVDPYSKNELFQGEKLTGIIDFGNFYLGPQMVDVGKCIMWNCCFDRKIDINLTRYFIKGYLSSRKLNSDETRYLKKAILYAIYSHIWVDLYHIPLKYVPESYTLFLVDNFLPVARQIEKTSFKIDLN